MAAAGVHLFSLVRAIAPALFRLAISVPGMAFIAAGALSGLWLLALLPLRALLQAFDLEGALALLRWLDLVPFAVAALSVRTSHRLPHETVRIRLCDETPESFVRMPVERRRGASATATPGALRVVQISDPHLGPWQPRPLLQRRIEELMAREPDLVLLTGDFLTMEGMGSGRTGAGTDAAACASRPLLRLLRQSRSRSRGRGANGARRERRCSYSSTTKPLRKRAAGRCRSSAPTT